MACKSIANVGDFNPSRRLLCNKSTFTTDDFVLVENRGMATLKDLSILFFYLLYFLLIFFSFCSALFSFNPAGTSLRRA